MSMMAVIQTVGVTGWISRLMKKMTDFLKMAVCPLLVFVLASGALVSCKKDKENDIPLPEEYEENIALPTSDQLDVTYSGKAVVLGSDRSDFSGSLVHRLNNATTTISDDAKAFVFTDDYVINFSEEQTKALLKAYVKGADFVFIDPEFPNFDEYRLKFNSAVESLLEEDLDFDLSDAERFFEKLNETDQMFTDEPYGDMEAVAFHDNRFYVVSSLDEQAEISDVSASGHFAKNEEGTEVDERDCATVDYEPTAYDCGKAADMLVEWMVNDSRDSEPDFSDSASDAIDKYMTGHRTVVQRAVGPSRALGRTLRYELVYTVYCAYDFDNNADYYYIRLEPNFHCDQLGCKNGDRNWVAANRVVVFDDGSTSGEFWSTKTDLWYGPYMSKFDYTGQIVEEDGTVTDGVTLLDATPHTDVSGTTGYTTGFSAGISGNFGFGGKGGPTGGITGSFTFSESHSHTENQLKVYHKTANNVPNWRIEGVVPQCHVGFLSYYHDEVATFQKNDWQTEFTWTVKVANPHRDKAYFLSGTDITEVTELNYSIYDYELRVHPSQNSMLRLPEPNRSNAKYIMNCSDDQVQDLIAKQFPDTWMNEFTYYALNDDYSYWGARAMFDKVKVAVKGYVSIMKQKGYNGKYTFTLNKLNGDQVSTFTIDNSDAE